MPYTDEQWQQHRGPRRPGRSRRSAPATSGSPWAASRPSSRSTTWTARNGTSPRSARHKRELREKLLRRLRRRFAPGGLLHFGQGKWYPGEQLPRWALSCYWRKDGVPMWRDRALLARTDEYCHRIRPEDAQRFAETLARAARRRSRLRQSGFRRPAAITCSASGNCRSTSIRSTTVSKTRASASGCAACSSAGWTRRSATCCRCSADAGKSGPEWQTGLWMLRGQHLFLVPGDSPMGLRLPLRACPGCASSEAPQLSAAAIRWPAAGAAADSAADLRRPTRRCNRARRHRERDRKPALGRVRAVGGAHRALRRAARRPAVRLHAAARVDRGLSRPGRRGRGHRGASEHAGRDRRLSRRRTIRASTGCR